MPRARRSVIISGMRNLAQLLRRLAHHQRAACKSRVLLAPA